MMGSMLRRGSLGDGSTLSLDFTTGVLDPRLSFTRASTATYINSQGYVATMAAAPTNDPTKARFDYDPTTLQPRGLLIEGSANNLTALSESFAGSGGSNNWNPSGLNGSAVTATTQTNPAGLSSSIRLVEDTANTAHAVFTAVSVSAGTQYTFSTFVRGDGTRTLAGLRITLSGAATDYSVIFDLADGTTGTAYTAGTPGTVTTSAVQHPGGWWRISVTMNAPAASTLFYIYNATTKNATAGLQGFTGTGNGIYVWGAQVEAGSGASSYIPTGASQGTRNSDVCYITNTDYGFTTTGGTYFVEWERGEYDNPTVSGSDCFAFSTDYASGRWLAIYTAPGSTTTSAGAWSGGINQGSTAVAGRNRAAVSYAGWNATTTGTLSVNGSSPTTSATMALGTTPTYLMIGAASQTSPYNGAGLRDILNNRVRRLKYWPFVLPSATLQSITVNTP